MWPSKDIVLVSVVGAVGCAALFEWLLWLMAFLYCFIKVYEKAEYWSTRFGAVAMMLIFTLIRMAFLPVLIISLPLANHLTNTLPSSVITGFQSFAFACLSAALAIPWLICTYQLIIHNLGRPKAVEFLVDDHSAPKVVVIMPCYKEMPDLLLRTVNSIVESEYPKSCIHVFLSFDGEDEDRLYLETIEQLGVPLVRNSGFPISIDVLFKEVRITISRFEHGGKRHCQKRTFKLVSKIYGQYMSVNDDIFVLLIDSDCILDKYCIQRLMYEMELKPGSEHNMLAMTGIITCTTERTSLITLMQDLEYVHGQLFERSVESGCGAVTCLPGALTVLRVSAFRNLAKEYFADKAEQCDDLFDYGKCHLGEDRWLTHLFMIASEKRYQIGVTTAAFCKTEAVRTFKALLKQRRRWFLGFVTNEVCMLTDSRVWKRYSFLCLIRLAQDTIRTTGLFFIVVLIALLTDTQHVNDLPMGFVVVALGLNWTLMIYFAAAIGRWKMLLYPLLFILGPFFDWMFIVYGVLTAGHRTWGGPRADAAQADALTSPQAAIELAKETGDDLNIVPESFRPAMENQTLGLGVAPSKISLQPSERLEGRFKSGHRDHLRPLAGSTDSEEAAVDTGVGHPMTRLHKARARSADESRGSIDSSDSVFVDARQSVHLPRRVESLQILRDSEGDARPSMVRSLTRDEFGSRAHPPSAGSALASLRLSQTHLEVPTRVRQRNSFSRRSSGASLATTVGGGRPGSAATDPEKAEKLAEAAENEADLQENEQPVVDAHEGFSLVEQSQPPSEYVAKPSA